MREGGKDPHSKRQIKGQQYEKGYVYILVKDPKGGAEAVTSFWIRYHWIFRSRLLLLLFAHSAQAPTRLRDHSDIHWDEKPAGNELS